MTMPVSGPGALSQRTDQPIRQVTGLPYGQAGALVAQQQGAPMSATPAPPSVTPLHAPTQRPGQPVTAGAAAGAGPGPEALTPSAVGMPAGGAISQALARVAASDNSGLFAQLLSVAQSKGL